MNKNFKILVVIILLIITLCASLLTYVTTSKMANPKDSNGGIPLLHNGTAVTNSSEVVMIVNKDTKKGRIVCFKEKLPNYLDGRVSDKCIDEEFYRADSFNGYDKFNIVRVYLDSASADVGHSYFFKGVDE